ncbi:hypothetical protein CROQUDRAFT_43502 [Cronartium quercuum f. sp. fusiforme G11]|uniref:Uncharacterized protein n=1 Tax=Cronartium quercuum f. sp. fusiforme G11 TaxID=708437 RepID=A0A9P6NMX5_9BASI|nr:hypothetical protein CROQUDRAFT_43502 [Cronartium quercuum f. sp. fusiforme G11]
MVLSIPSVPSRLGKGDDGCRLETNPPQVPPRTYSPLTSDVRSQIANWTLAHPISEVDLIHDIRLGLNSRLSLHLEQSPLRQRRLAKRLTPLASSKSFSYRRPRLVLKPRSRPRPIQQII